MSAALHRSGEWSLFLGVSVLDPDGWDRTNFQKSWNEPITLDEFKRRVAESTVWDGGDL